jgi:hypothetical protein
LTEYVDKMLKTLRPSCLRHHRGKIAAIGPSPQRGVAGAKKERRNKALAPYGTALSPARQTRYEVKSSFGGAVS